MEYVEAWGVGLDVDVRIDPSLYKVIGVQGDFDEDNNPTGVDWILLDTRCVDKERKAEEERERQQKEKAKKEQAAKKKADKKNRERKNQDRWFGWGSASPIKDMWG